MTRSASAPMSFCTACGPTNGVRTPGQRSLDRCGAAGSLSFDPGGSSTALRSIATASVAPTAFTTTAIATAIATAITATPAAPVSSASLAGRRIVPAAAEVLLDQDADGGSPRGHRLLGATLILRPRFGKLFAVEVVVKAVGASGHHGSAVIAARGFGRGIFGSRSAVGTASSAASAPAPAARTRFVSRIIIFMTGAGTRFGTGHGQFVVVGP